MSLRPVNSEKHEITFSNLAADFGTADVAIEIVKAVSLSDVNLAIEVPVGATVKWIFFELNFAAQVTTNPKILHWMVVKRPFGSSIGTPSSYNQNSKRFVLKRGMEMLPSDVATVFKRIFVVKIPPRLRRMGDNDSIFLVMRASSTETINGCGFMIYKHFN